MMNKLASINRGASVVPIFGTMTYPDHFPPDPEVWKDHLERWYDRMVYDFGPFAMVWRFQLEVRKSGASKGQLAPHFHVLMFLDKEPAELYEAMSRHWYEACGELDPKHLKAGTGVEDVRSWRGVMNYAARYVARVEKVQISADSPEYAAFPGRHWGVKGRKYLPVLIRDFAMAVEHGLQVKRTLRKYSGQRGREKYTTLYCYLPHERLLALLDYVEGRSPPDRSLHERINSRMAV